MEPNSVFVGADKETCWALEVMVDDGGVGADVHGTPCPPSFPDSTTRLNSALWRRRTASCGCSGGAMSCDYLEGSR